MKSVAGSPLCIIIDSPNLTLDTRVKITVIARPLLKPVAQTLYGCEHDVFTIRTCVIPPALVTDQHFLCPKMLSLFCAILFYFCQATCC